jgi:hypothetical protein
MTHHTTREPRTPEALAQDGVHPCPVTDCATTVSPGHLACKRHWMQLDAADRQRLARSFRARETNPEGYQAATTWALSLLSTLNPKDHAA